MLILMSRLSLVPHLQKLSTTRSITFNACEDKSATSSFVRQAVASEQLSSAFFEAQATGHDRPDLNHFHSNASQLLEDAETLQAKLKSQPSALQFPIRVFGLSLGFLSRVAPRNISLSISGAIDDALVEHYTDTLRQLQESRESGEDNSNKADEIRVLIRHLRDQSRAPDGSPPAPDLLALSKIRDVSDISRLGLVGLVGAVAKFSTLVAIHASRKL